jgi:hypothetical protein
VRRVLIAVAVVAAALAAWWLLRGEGRVAAPSAPAVEPPAPAAPKAAQRTPRRSKSEPQPPAPELPADPEASVSRIPVIVVDAAGRPCGGVRVVAVRETSPGTFVATQATTDAADGTASVLTVRDGAGSGKSGAPTLAVALPFADPSLAVEVRSAPGELVRFVLPSSGRVRCELVDEHDAPAAGGYVVHLRRAGGDGFGHCDDACVPAAGGTALFPYVGLGLELEAVAWPGAGGITSSRRFEGPRTAGEETVVRITVGDRRPAIVGRLVDGKGAPIAGMRLFGAIVEPGQDVDVPGTTDGESTTGPDGRFRFVLVRPPGDAAPAKLQIGRSVKTGKDASAVRRFAIADVPAGPPAADADVGDVVFQGTELLVAGVVVDSAGRPLEGAVVRAISDDAGGDRGASDDVDASITRADGRFRLVGAPAGPRLEIGVNLTGHCVDGPLEFATGATDVRVVMSEAGAIAGSVLFPEGVPRWRACVTVDGPTSENGGFETWFGGPVTARVGNDGRFELGQLRPGKACVKIRFGWSEGDTVLAVDDVAVVAGEVTRDPRLARVDLANALHGLRVTVADANGARIGGADVHFRPSGSATFWERVESSETDGIAVVQSGASEAARNGFDVVVTQRGYRSVEVRAAKSDVKVVLEKAKASVVRVRLAANSPLPDPPFQVSADLKWAVRGTSDADAQGPGARDVSGTYEYFGKQRTLTFQTYDPGRYRVELTLWDVNMTESTGEDIATVPSAVEFDVPAEGSTVDVEVGVDAEQLRKLTARDR